MRAATRHQDSLEPDDGPRPAMSVVLCSYNGADGVGRCLAALRDQTIADRLELIVVVDGSTDATAATAVAGGARVGHAPRSTSISDSPRRATLGSPPARPHRSSGSWTVTAPLTAIGPGSYLAGYESGSVAGVEGGRRQRRRRAHRLLPEASQSHRRDRLSPSLRPGPARDGRRGRR